MPCEKIAGERPTLTRLRLQLLQPCRDFRWERRNVISGTVLDYLEW